MLRVHVQRGEAPASVYVFEDRSIVIGRGEGADLVLPFADVSRRQCRVVAVQGGAAVEELSASGGTFVDGVRVRGRVALEGASRVRFGACTMWVRVEGSAVGEQGRGPEAARDGLGASEEAAGAGDGRRAAEEAAGEGDGRRAAEGGPAARARGEAEWLMEAARRWCERGRPTGLLLDRRGWSRGRWALAQARALHPDDPRVALVEASGRALRARRWGRGIAALIAAAAVLAGVAAGNGFEDAWPALGRAPSGECEAGAGQSGVESLRALEDGIARGCRTERAEAATWAAIAGRGAARIGGLAGAIASIEAVPGRGGAVVVAGVERGGEGDVGRALVGSRGWIDEAATGLVALDGDVDAALGEGKTAARSADGEWRAAVVGDTVEVWARARAVARWPAPGEGAAGAIEVGEDGTTLVATGGRWYLRRVGERRWRGLGEGAAALCGAACAVIGGRDGGLSRVSWEGGRWRERRLTSMRGPVIGVRRAGRDAVVAVGEDGAIAQVSLTASWRRAGEAVRIDLRQGDGRLRGWAVSAAGRVLAAVDRAGRVALWTIGEGGARPFAAGWSGGASGPSDVTHGDAAELAAGATAVGFVGEVLIVGDARGDVWRQSLGEGEDGAGGVVHAGAVSTIALAGDGRGASVDTEGVIRIWRADMGGGARVDATIEGEAVVRALAVEPEGRRVAAAIGERVWVWEGADAGWRTGEVRSAGGSVTRVAFAGAWLVAGDVDGGLVGWEVGADGVAHEGRSLGGHAVGITALAVDGAMAASGDAEGRVRRWRLGSAAETKVEMGRGAPVVELSIDGDRMVAGRADGEVWIDAGAGAVKVMPAGDGPRAMAVAPGGATVAIAGSAGELWLWRAGEGTPRVTAVEAGAGAAGEGRARAVGLGFASEERLVVVDAGGGVRLWSVGSAGREVEIGEIGAVAAGREVAVAARGGVVAVGDGDGRVQVWPATPGGAVLAGCRRLGVGCG